MGDNTILETHELTKRFGGITAVDNVSINVDRGELLGIIGPNGAGKTTLFNLITGFETPDSGRIVFKGVDVTRLRPEKRVVLGMARTFQIVRPFKRLTVRDNLRVAAYSLDAHRKPNKPLEERIDEILSTVGLYEKRFVRAELLTHGELKKLEVARALVTEPDLLLLDEPFGGLTTEEVKEISDVILSYREAGGTVVIIEHRLRELMKLVKRVLVMDNGSIIFEGRPEEVVNSKRVIEAYLGRGIKSFA